MAPSTRRLIAPMHGDQAQAQVYRQEVSSLCGLPLDREPVIANFLAQEDLPYNFY